MTSSTQRAIAKTDRAITAFLKKYLPPIYHVLRKIQIRKKTASGLRSVRKCYEQNRPIEQRVHLPLLTKVLHLKGEGVEIGVLEGYFSETILLYSDLSRLHSIDPWREFDTTAYDDCANTKQQQHEEKYQFTQERLKKYGERSNILRMTSEEAARQFQGESLDFVYIDANHSYEEGKKDIMMWWPKVKKGGIFSGHDYLDDQLPEGNFGIKRAVDEFTKEHNQDVFVIAEKWPTWYLMKK